MTDPTTTGAFIEGQIAAKDGKKIARCPYPEKTKPLLWGAWRNGWATETEDRRQQLEVARMRMQANPPRKRTRT